MTTNRFPVRQLFDVLSSHLHSLGTFTRTATHEPKSAPGKGLFAAVILDSIAADPESSGLNVTSSRITFIIRIMSNMIVEPQDNIDPDLLDAIDLVYTELNGDFDLSVAGVKNVDVMGMRTRTGYVDQDGKKYRVADISVPILVSDVWDQE